METGMKDRLQDCPDVSFIENTSFSDMLQAMTVDYQEEYRRLTGKEISLAQADPSRLILQSCAVTIYQAFQHIDRAGKMGLIKYSKGDFLDNLASLKKVTRNPATKATATLRFTLSAVLKRTVTIPAGTRVKAGELYFETQNAAEIQTGEISVDVPCVCQTAGKAGNEFLPGEISTLVDLLGYNLSVLNIDESSGGSDRESDEALAERVYLAPSSYSTAGSEASYRYWVASYSQAIKSCKIVSDSPGQVDIYIAMENGTLPDATFLEALERFLEDENIRPLTDRVLVHGPDVVSYDIDITYYIGKSQQDRNKDVRNEVEAACQRYIDWQKGDIGRDINPSQLTYFLMQSGLKWVDIRAPVFTSISDHAVAIAGQINLVDGGSQDD